MSDNIWPPNAPNPREHAYRLWTSGTPESVARARFKSRYGESPEWIIDHLGWLWVGPVPERSREIELKPAN